MERFAIPLRCAGGLHAVTMLAELYSDRLGKVSIGKASIGERFPLRTAIGETSIGEAFLLDSSAESSVWFAFEVIRLFRNGMQF